VTLRLVETHGGTAEVALASDLGTVAELTPADLLEEPRGGPAELSMAGYEIATVLGRPEMPTLLDAQGAVLGPDAEDAQPLYARYWLHNRGPAPIGGLPVVAHLHPHEVRTQAGSVISLRLTAASDCTDATLRGTVRLVCPDGWSAAPAELPFTLQAGEHAEADVSVTLPPRAVSGLYPVRALLTVTDTDVPSAWRQSVEDVCVISVHPNWTRPRDRLLRLVRGPAPVDLAAGETATVTVTVGTDAFADITAEAHLISPWGTWEWMGPPARGAVIPARGNVGFEFEVHPPAWCPTGQWWAMVRVAAAGRVVYSPAVSVTVHHP
jgi:alpha-mannosidase